MPVTESFARRINRQRQHHRCYLWIAAVVVVLAFAMTVRSDQRVALRLFPDLSLPESCLSRSCFGMDCPGCGLTRSFIYLAAGNPAASYAAHRVGWLLALAVLGQFPYRWFVLRRSRGHGTSSNLSATDSSGAAEQIEPTAAESTGDAFSATTGSAILFRTPAWIEAFAKLLLVALIGNWVLKVLGY